MRASRKIIASSLIIFAAVGLGYWRARPALIPWIENGSRTAEVELLSPGAEPRRTLRYDFSRITAKSETFELVFEEGVLVIRGALQGQESRTPRMAFLFAHERYDELFGVLHERVTV